MGIQQCDSFGAALFPVTVDPFVKNLNSELDIRYLSDATIAGMEEKTLKDLRAMKTKLDEVGLKILTVPNVTYLFYIPPPKNQPRQCVPWGISYQEWNLFHVRLFTVGYINFLRTNTGCTSQEHWWY